MEFKKEDIENCQNNWNIIDLFYGLYVLTFARWFNPEKYFMAHQVMDYMRRKDDPAFMSENDD